MMSSTQAEGLLAHKSLRDQVRILERLQMLCCPGLAVDEIGDVTLKIAMLVAFRHSRALHHASRTLFHAAVAGHSDVAAQTVGSRHQLPSRSSAKRAIFKGHVVGAGPACGRQA